MFSVSVGVLSKILDFDIFVRYESVNLNDYRHFQVFCIHMSLIEHQCTTACQYQQAQRRERGHSGVLVGLEVCQQAQRRASVHKGVTGGTAVCQQAQRCANMHKGVLVGIEACKWAQRRASGHNGVLVGIEVRQQAQRRISRRRSASVGTNACKWAQRRASGREDGIGKTSINKGEPVQVGQTSKKARRRRKIFSHFSKLQIEGGGFNQIEGGVILNNPIGN